MNLVNKLKNNTIIYKIVRKVYDTMRFTKADLLLWSSKKNYNHNDVIKVVIISQMSNLWNNYDELYQKLLKDDRFEPYIFMVPGFDYSKKVFDMKSMDTNIYDFHKEHQNTIKAYDEGIWYDLKSLKPDYVLFERPYSPYLPKQYQIKNVCQYARTCYLPYGYEMMNYLFDTSLNIDFFRYLYMYFADSFVTDSYNRNRTKYSHRLKIRKTVLTGHPIFNSFLMSKQENRNKDYYNILWAPRWTIDDTLGGSNFLNYKDKIVEYIEENKNTRLVFRPHPLTFQNFISLGLITEKEAEEYKRLFVDNERLYYDKAPGYFETFWQTDVFVGDISSIIPCYFLTGKPIIYCHTASKDDNEVMKKIFSVSYHAYSYDDAKKILDDLLEGIDPLKEKRLKMKDELFSKKYTVDVVSNIVDAFLKDHESR